MHTLVRASSTLSAPTQTKLKSKMDALVFPRKVLPTSLALKAAVLSVLVLTQLLASVDAQTSPSPSHAALTSAEQFLYRYREVLNVVVGGGGLCSPEELGNVCSARGKSVVFQSRTDIGISRPSVLASACVAAELEQLFTELAANLTRDFISLYFIEAGGTFFSAYSREVFDTAICDTFSSVDFSPRAFQTYINTVSSPKSIAIVNVDTRSSLGTSESIIATQYLLQQTLTNSDYFTVFAPGFNRTSAFGSAEFIKATPEHIEQVLDMLQNQTAEAIDYGLITEALLALNSSENCYRALIVASSARNLANQELGDAILAGYDGTMSFPIILYALGMGAEFDRTYSGVPYCSSNTALLEVTSNTSYYGYLNYFVDGSSPVEATIFQYSSALLTNISVTTACVPILDGNLATITGSGALLGVLCLEFSLQEETNETCPTDPLSFFDFTFLRHAYQGPGPNPFYSCDSNLPTSYQTSSNLYWSLVEDFVSSSATVGQLAYRIVQSDFVGSTCPYMEGNALLGCSNAGGSLEMNQAFQQPVSFASSSLVWAADLLDILPIDTADFNDLDSNQTLWQSMCASSYLDDPWRGVLSGLLPSMFLYGDYKYGYIRNFPGHLQSSATCMDQRKLDARLQSWFSSAASGPKAVVLIIDNKFGFYNDTMEMKEAALAVLETLNQHDRFVVLSTNEPLGPFRALVPGLQSNLDTANEFVRQLDFSTPGSRDPNAVISLAVQYLDNSLRMSSRNQANYAFILLTDNSFIDPSGFSFTTVLDPHTPFFLANNIRVFNFLFSAFQEATLLKNVSCTTGGRYDRLQGLSSLENALRVTSYYNFFASSPQDNEYVWSEVFRDELTGLNSSSVCSPYYEASEEGMSAFNTLIGVTCITVPVMDNLTIAQQQALNTRIYLSQAQVVSPNLTFDEENQLRGSHICDRIEATSAESFRFRVENTVRLFRSTAEEVYGDLSLTPGVSSCSYGNQLYDSCFQGAPRPQTSPSPYYGCDVNAEATGVYTTAGFLAGTLPLLNFSINAFAENPELFNVLCMTEAINNLWISTQEQRDEGVLWQYYGDYLSGVLRFYPYANCSLGDPNSRTCQTREYDPRLRPWYVSSISGPKAVYIVVHSTNPDEYTLMQLAALDILNTLTHRDFINVQFTFDSASKYTDGFVRSTNSTRGQIANFIRNQGRVTQQLDLNNVLSEAYEAFEGASFMTCHRTVILFTDSSLSQNVLTAVNNLKDTSQLPVDVFTYSFGGIVVNPTVAQEIACSNDGEWFSVSSLQGFDQMLHSYYKFYAASVQNSGVVWSDFFTDALTGRNVTSACLPVYNPSTVESAPQLLGVTCVDVDPLRFDDFSDGYEVLRSITDTDAIFCPTREITEEKRETLRLTKCSRPSIISPEDLANFYEEAIMESALLHSEAYATVVQESYSADTPISCPLNSGFYDSCSGLNPLPDGFSYSDRFAGNVSFSNLGVIVRTDEEGTLNLDMLTSNETFFNAICPTVVEERVWQRTVSEYNLTNLQSFTSEDGVLVTYPSRQLSGELCEQVVGDPRMLNYYASTVSGPKDIIIVIDLSSAPLAPFITSIFAEATQYVLTSLSYLDYFNIVAGNDTFRPLLVRADNNSIEEAIEFLSTLTYQSASKDLEVQKAFRVFNESRLIAESTLCQSALIIITDFDVTEETVQRVQVLNQRFTEDFSKPVKIFLNSFGSVSQGRTPALELVCNNHGILNVIKPSEFGTSSTIRAKVISYYRVLASAGSLNFRNPLWSGVYSDPFGVGAVTSVCLPVYDTRINIGALLGVSCISVPVSLFEQFPNGAQFLGQFLLSQRDSDLQCSVVSLTPEEIDQFRPDGYRCAVATPLSTPTASQTTTPGSPTGIPTASQTPTPSSPTASPSDENPGSSSSTSAHGSGLDDGEIAGITIAVIVFCVAVVICIAIGTFIVLKRKNKYNVVMTSEMSGRKATQDLQQTLLQPGDDTDL